MSHVDTAPAASTPRAAEGRRPRRVKSQRSKSEARLGWLLAGKPVLKARSEAMRER